jgi:hypothetical protein
MARRCERFCGAGSTSESGRSGALNINDSEIDRIQAELESGTLRILRLAAGTECRIPLFLLFPGRISPGPAAEHLTSILQEAV